MSVEGEGQNVYFADPDRHGLNERLVVSYDLQKWRRCFPRPRDKATRRELA